MREAMHPGVLASTPDASLAEVARVHHLVVVDGAAAAGCGGAGMRHAQPATVGGA